MSSDTSNSGIMQKADQIAFHFYTKLFYTVNQARATEEPHSQGKIDKWFNLETPDSDLFTREARDPYRNISLSPPLGPPPLEIQVLLCIPELTNNQVLIHRSDPSTDTTDPSTQQPSSSSTGPIPARLRIEPTPRSIVLETWTLTFVPHGSSNRLGDQALPTIYKHGIPLFRSLYSLLRILPVWKLYKRLKRRTGGVNRNGHLGISLRVKPLEETDEASAALDILAFDTPPSPSHRPLQTQTHIFSPLPHPLGSLTLSATYLSSSNFELDELESHLSSRFISLDLQGFVPTLSKHAAREEREDSGGRGVGPNVGARSPPRTIMGAIGGRSGQGHAHGLSHGLGVGTGLGLPSAIEGTSSISSMGRPVVTATNTSDNASVAERFIIPSRVPSFNLAATTSSSSSALMPLPTSIGTAVTASPGISGPGRGGSPSPEIFSSSISPYRISHSQSPHPHSPYPYPPSLSSSPVSVGIGAVPIKRPGSGVGINPFKGNTLSSTSASAGSSPSLSIRQGLSTSVAILERQEDATGGVGIPARMPPTRKRYSSSFGNRYVGSVGSTGSGGGGGSGAGESGGSTPASVGGTGATGGVGVDGGGKGKEHNVSGGTISFLSTATDDDDISTFVQDIDSRKPLSGRAKEREKRGRDREKEKEWRERDKDANEGQGHDRETRRDNVGGKGNEEVREEGGLVTFPTLGQRQRSPLSPLSVREGEVRQRALPPSPSTVANTTLPLGMAERKTVAALASGSTTTTPPDTTAQSQSTSPPARGPMLTNQDEVEERLKRMNETFRRSLEGMGRDGGGTRRGDKEKGKEKDTARRGLSLLVPSNEGEFPSTSATNNGGDSGGQFVRTRTISGSPHSGQTSEHRTNPIRILSPSSISPSSSSSGSGSSSKQPLHPQIGFGLGLGLGRGRGLTSTSTSTSVSSEANDASIGQGSEEVIGRMDFYDESRRRPRMF